MGMLLPKLRTRVRFSSGAPGLIWLQRSPKSRHRTLTGLQTLLLYDVNSVELYSTVRYVVNMETLFDLTEVKCRLSLS